MRKRFVSLKSGTQKEVRAVRTTPTVLLDDFAADTTDIGLVLVGFDLGNPPYEALSGYLSLAFFWSVKMRCRSKSVLNVIVTESPFFNPLSLAMKSFFL